MRRMRTLPARSDEAENAGHGTRITSGIPAVIRAVATLAIIGTACGSSPPASGSSDAPTTGVDDGGPNSGSPIYALGEFPEFPDGALP